MHKIFDSQVEQRSFPAGAVHNFYLYGPISDDANNYVDMITVMDIADEHDKINLFINTVGGALHTTISIIHAMMRSEAQIVCHADGTVASAGTLIFFAAQTYVIYPYSNFMFHDGAMGTYGKINEGMKNIAASSKLVERLASDLYIPVFSQEEVDIILEGRDYYCSSEEMLERVHNAAQEEESEQEADPETKENLQGFTPATDTEREITFGSRVQVIKKGLKTYGKQGTITFVNVNKQSVEVIMDEGNSITISRHNIEVIG
jgi:ATP-dependent protease ClpP protease subunit